MFLWRSLLYLTVSSSDKWTYCKSLWIKASAKRRGCKCSDQAVQEDRHRTEVLFWGFLSVGRATGRWRLGCCYVARSVFKDSSLANWLRSYSMLVLGVLEHSGSFIQVSNWLHLFVFLINPFWVTALQESINHTTHFKLYTYLCSSIPDVRSHRSNFTSTYWVYIKGV